MKRLTPLLRMPGHISVKKLVEAGGMVKRAPVRRERATRDKLVVWLNTAVQRGYLHLGDVERDPEVEVGPWSENWPEWVSINRVAQAAAFDLGHSVNASIMGSIMMEVLPKAEKRTKTVLTKFGKRGSVLRTENRVMYRIGPFQRARLTDTI